MSDSSTSPVGRRDLTQGPLFWTMFRLAAPMAIGMLLRNLYNLVDAFWLGKLSKEALGAPAVSMPLIFAMLSFGFGFGAAATALVAQHTGAKQHREADRTAAQALVVLTALAFIFSIPVILFPGQVLAFLRVPQDVIANAAPYMQVYMLAMPLSGFCIGYSSVLRALGDTHTTVVIDVICNLMNFVLDPLLIFGWKGFVPAMGAQGAAIASVIGIVFSFIMCFTYMRQGRAGFKPRSADFKPDIPLLKNLFRIGIPSGLSVSIEAAGFIVFQAMINYMGAAVIGAFMVGSRIMNFLDTAGACTSMAAAPVVGQALGAGKVPLARRVVLHSTAMFAAVMILPYAFLMWQGTLIARIFINDPGVLAEVQRFFLIIPASSYFFNVMGVLLAAYRGSGHMRLVLIITVIRQWLLRLPICLIFGFALAWGSKGIYVGMAVANLAAAAVTYWMFKQGEWETPVIALAGKERKVEDGIVEALDGETL